MTLPHAGNSQTDRAGISVITMFAVRDPSEGGLGFMFREQPIADVGVDGHLEIYNEAREATGRILGVQIKTGASYFSRRYEGGWTVYVDKPTVRYWRQYAVPVILTIVDLQAFRAYWVLVSTGDFSETAEYFKIGVPESQVFDRTAIEALTELAAVPPPSLATRLSLPPALALEKRQLSRLIRLRQARTKSRQPLSVGGFLLMTSDPPTCHMSHYLSRGTPFVRFRALAGRIFPGVG